MATCTDTVNQILATHQVPSLPVFFANTVNLFNFQAGNNGVYFMDVPIFQSTLFQVSTSFTGVILPNFTISIYSVDDAFTVATLLGTVNITNVNSSFPKDMTTGKYLFCFNALAGSYTGTITPIVTGYSTSAQLSPRAYEGTNFQATIPYIRPPKPCFETMYFQIVDGSLPPGLQMDGLGRIFGQLPNLDCVHDDDPLSPSVNWFYENLDGNADPWGRQWRFKVKAWVASYPVTAVEQWMCISVVNNWDFDKNNFASQTPFQHDIEVQTTVAPKTLPLMCTPCSAPPEATIPSLASLPVIDPSCPTCTVYDIPAEATRIKSANDAVNFFLEHQNDTFCCQEIQDFIAALKTDKNFQQLLAQSGYGFSVEGATAIAQITGNQLVLNTLINGRNATDLDYLMQQWRDEVNQSLPTTIVSITGESTQVSLQQTSKFAS